MKITELYKKYYYQLIEYRKINTLPNDIYGEYHHIIPKCIGGTNTNENLIRLTAREHYIAHLLLVRIYKNTKYYYKMLSAVTMMQCSSDTHQNGRNFKFSSRLYEKIRIECSRLDSIFHKELWKNKTEEERQAFSKKVSETIKSQSDEWKKQYSITMSNALKNRSDEKKREASRKMSEAWHRKNEEEKREIIEKREKIKANKSQEEKEKTKEKFRKTMSEKDEAWWKQYSINMSNALKNRSEEEKEKTKEKIALAWKNKSEKELNDIRDKQRNSLLNTINNMSKEEREEYLRKISPCKGKIWIHNDSIKKSIIIFPNELDVYLKNGWSKGRIKWNFQTKVKNMIISDDVIKNIKMLPEKAQKISHLFYIDKKTYEEIASELNISPGTVCSVIYKYRKRLNLF